MSRIMIVDDTQFIRTRIAKLLVKQGYDTVEAENGEEAVQTYRSTRPNAVLMDITRLSRKFCANAGGKPLTEVNQS